MQAKQGGPAHEYAQVKDPAAVCRVNLSVKLFSASQSGKDWKRWAKAVGDQEIIEAVNEAVKAIQAAHKLVTKRERRGASGEDEEA